MATEGHSEGPELDESSWIYLSAGSSSQPADSDLLDQIIEACAKRLENGQPSTSEA